jgi:hypothetical protein
MATLPQRRHTSGQAVQFRGEGGEDGKPIAMPVPDANANKHLLGRSGTLKAGRPMNLGGGGLTMRNQKKRRK